MHFLIFQLELQQHQRRWHQVPWARSDGKHIVEGAAVSGEDSGGGGLLAVVEVERFI